MKKISYLFLLVTLIFLGSCQKKELKIPTTDIKGIQEITNFSEIWMFMEIKKNDTLVNLKENNVIGSTHWIFNIDKNLPLKKVIPNLQKFQEKRLKKSLHATEGFNNYLSYSDTISKILSFVDITKTHFHYSGIQSEKNILTNNDNYKNFNNYHLRFGIKDYYINENKIKKSEFFETLIVFISVNKTVQSTVLHLEFNQELSYQEYIHIKTHLLDLQQGLFIIDKNEYFFGGNKFSE